MSSGWKSDDVAAKVLFFNVGNGLLRPDRLKEAVEQSQADIVGLAELSSTQADALQGLSELYPFQALYGLGIPGKGLLSRWPLDSVELVELHTARPDLRASAMIPIGDSIRALQIIVAHPPPQRTRLRTEQLKAILKLATGGEPTLLMGDFNMVQAQAAYRVYRAAGLRDAYREAGTGRGLTYPVRRAGLRLRPLLRIDYIWYTHQLVARRAWVGVDHGSDHLPLFAEMVLQNDQPT
jgi:endonuclease/exonuclease/phosphatase family metal-dependent hydrolase